MKQLFIVTVISLFISGFMVLPHKTFASELTPEINFGLQYFNPSDDDTYDSGVGVEAQARFWQNKNIGFGISAGLSNWQVKDSTMHYSDSTLNMDIDTDGSVTMLPVGGSVLARIFPHENLTLLFEGGLRYVIVESNADISVEGIDNQGTYIKVKEEADIDNGIVGLASISAKSPLSKTANLSGTLGYQFDIHKGDVKWLGEKMFDHELESFFVSVGLELNF